MRAERRAAMQRSSDPLRLYGSGSNWDNLDQNSTLHQPPVPHSRCSSQSTIATNDSSPMSPTFGDFSRHSRIPSSNTSLSSSPNPAESIEFGLPNKRTHLEGLPELDEDTSERDPVDERIRYIKPAQPAYGGGRWSYESPKPRPATTLMSWLDATEHDSSSSDYEGHFSKRRRSGNFGLSNIATEISSRFPSVSKRARERKRMSLSIPTARLARSPSPSPSPTILSRASSFKRSFGRRSVEQDAEPEDSHMMHSNIETILERDSIGPSEDQFYVSEWRDEDPDLVDAEAALEARSTTPILPPLLENSLRAARGQSPLQSPTVAVDGEAISNSPGLIGTPLGSGTASPIVSAKPSMASMRHHSPTRSNDSPLEIPPLVMVDPSDAWAERLGHANFKIEPEPYVPSVCDANTCEALLADWQRARSEYAKHLSRTEMHFGRSSMTFQLTEEKWASIDAQWKYNSEITSRRAVASGYHRSPSPKQPAPVARIPPVDDPRLIQSEEIPGPMTMDEPVRWPNTQMGRRPSKREKFLKMIGNFQFPNPALSRSAMTAGGR